TFDERFGLEDPEDDICKYDFVEVEEPSDGTILGRWCGSGFCIHYNIVMPNLP
ncbi:PDGFC isoform 4, partial [Pan troglodytes]